MSTFNADFGVSISDSRVVQIGGTTIHDKSWITVSIDEESFLLKKQTCILEVQFSVADTATDVILLTGQLQNTSQGQMNVNKTFAIRRSDMPTADLYSLLLAMLAINSSNQGIVGEIRAFASATAIPSNYLICDGREFDISAYPDLANAIGTIYGTPSAMSKFKIPNTQLRMLVHADGTNVGVGTILNGIITDDQLPIQTIAVDNTTSSDTQSVLAPATLPVEKPHYSPSVGVIFAICWK